MKAGLSDQEIANEFAVNIETRYRLEVTNTPLTGISYSPEKIAAVIDPSSVKSPKKPLRKLRGLASLISGR